LANHTTFRIGGEAKYFFVAKTQADFALALRVVKDSGTPFYILGGGSNLLASDDGFEGLVIKNQSSNLKTQNYDGKLKVVAEAGVSFGRIILETINKGYSGAEWGFGIPGSIGGAIFGNAGRLGQAIAQVVESVRVLDKNIGNERIRVGQSAFY